MSSFTKKMTIRALICAYICYVMTTTHTMIGGDDVDGSLFSMMQELSSLQHFCYFMLPAAPIVICLVTSIYCLKHRLEAQGSGTNPFGKNDAPLEFVFTVGILWMFFNTFLYHFKKYSSSSSVSFLKEIATISWLFLPLYITFVVIPWSFPSLSPSILGCKLPPTNRPDKFSILVRVVLKYGTIKEQIKLVLVILFGSINLIVMGIEDYLYPIALQEFDSSRLVFILGHPRSGTTNLHKSLANHDKTRVSTFLDLFCPAGSLRWCMEMFLKPLLHALITIYDTPHHRFGIDEELEEHIWLLALLGTHSTIFLFFPALIQQSNFEDIYKSIISIDDDDDDNGSVDMIFLKRILARRCNAILKRPDEKYIAKPITLSRYLKLFEKYFPDAKYIICARNRQEAFLSHVRLTSQMVLGHDNDLEDPTLKELCKCMAMYYSKPTFEVVEDCVSNQEDTTKTKRNDMEIVQFSTWTTQPEQVLAHLLKFLELEKQTVADNSSLKMSTSMTQNEDKKKALSGLVNERTEFHEPRTFTRIPSFVQLALQ